MSCAVTQVRLAATEEMISIKLTASGTQPPKPQLNFHSTPHIPQSILHTYILSEILHHLPKSNLPSTLRVSSIFYQTALPILYSEIHYLPDRSGPTSFDGLDQPLNLKRRALEYTKHLRIGYHHHNDHHTLYPPLITRTHPVSIDFPALKSIAIAGERFCTHKSCPYLSTSRPDNVIINKIDLFSGSPRWINPFLVPCHDTTHSATLLVQSPFFLKRGKMQGLDDRSKTIRKQTFIFALREYESEWRDTARRMSDKDPDLVLVDHLAELCSSPVEEINIVGLELVAPHLRVVEELSSAYPEDIVSNFEYAVGAMVRGKWAERGSSMSSGRSVEDQLKRCRFWTLREYASGALPVGLDRDLIDRWAASFEHVVASSGIERRG